MSVVGFPEITPNNFVRLLREAVEDGRIIWTIHVRDRMNERNISSRLIVDCLKKGQLDGSPEPNENGNLSVRMKRRVSGVQLTLVVGLSKQDNGLYAVVVTAF